MPSIKEIDQNMGKCNVEVGDWFRIANCPQNELEINLRNSRLHNDDIWLVIFNTVPFLTDKEIKSIADDYRTLQNSDSPKDKYISVAELLSKTLEKSSDKKRYNLFKQTPFLKKTCFNYDIPKVDSLEELLKMHKGQFPYGGEFAPVFSDISLLYSVGAITSNYVYDYPNYSSSEEAFTITQAGKEFAEVSESLFNSKIIPCLTRETRIIAPKGNIVMSPLPPVWVTVNVPK